MTVNLIKVEKTMEAPDNTIPHITLGLKTKWVSQISPGGLAAAAVPELNSQSF